MDPHLLAAPEGKTLEFKRDLSSPEPVLRTLVAFANTAGGTLLIGVEDRTRRVRGVADPLATERDLANLVSDHIEPRLVPEIEIVPWRRTHLVAVQVFPSPLRPHHLRRLGPERGVFVRVGSTNRQADSALIEELRRSVRPQTFDEQPIPELNSEAVDFRAASQQFSELRKLKRSDLRSLGVLTTHAHRLVPTVGGLLLFGRERERYFPDAWIQVARFGGTDRTRIVDHRELRDHLAHAAEQAIEFVQRHVQAGIEINAARHTVRSDLPLVAVREAVINAVVHADYAQRGAPIRVALFDDRLEVSNPGLLVAGLTIDDIRQGVSKLRNRVIGRVFHAAGLIEQWGSGIQRMEQACRQTGLPMPILEEIATQFRVTFGRQRVVEPTLADLDERIVALLRGSPGLSTQAIAAAIKRTPRATRTRLRNLVGRGIVVELGKGPHDPRKRYLLPSSPS